MMRELITDFCVNDPFKAKTNLYVWKLSQVCIHGNEGIVSKILVELLP